MKTLFLFGLVLAFAVGCNGNGSFMVDVLLKGFSNPDNRTLAGVECDGPDLLSPDCTLGFKICVEAYSNQNYTYNMSSCSTGWRDTGFLDSHSNNVTFAADTQYGAWANPSRYYFNQQYTAVTFKLQARDKSPMTPWSDQIVDNFVHIIQMGANSQGIIQIWHPRSNHWTTIKPTKTQLSVRISCMSGTAPFCEGGSNYTTPAYTTYPPANPCANGGTFYQNRCYCRPGYFGPQCREENQRTSTTTERTTATYPFWTTSSINCLNGGTDMGGWCYCPPDFYGSHCQYFTTAYPFNVTTEGTTQQPSNNNTCGIHGILFQGTCYCDANYCGTHCEQQCRPAVTLPTYKESSNAEEDLLELCEHLLTSENRQSDPVIRICHSRLDQVMKKIENQRLKLSQWKNL